ncbi:MAG: TIGR02099 family protein [Burkholderiaceae bacterium]|jgi:uncharacterized protein (TIGR02099 family)|nr:TIGR02099 family protein [Burkholderiaceae bacterium]
MRLAATLMRWATRVVAAAFVLLALAWAVLHWVIVPRIDDWRPRLQKLASDVLAAPVTIGAIRAESNALIPAVTLLDVRVHDPAGRAGLHVPRVLAAFSVLSLARGGLEQLVIEQPQLEVRRTAQGRLLVAGLDLSGDAAGDAGAADWFFSQREFLVRGARITWIDEQRAAPPVSLSDVQLVVRNGRRRHRIRLDATPPGEWGERFTVIGHFRQPVLSLHPGQWRDWSGRLYADLPRMDISRLRQYADLQTEWGVDLHAGQGALRAWAHLSQGALADVTTDLALSAVSARLAPELEPLAFDSVGGRIGWRNHDGVVGFETRGLHFVDADGLAWPGGNFSLTYRGGLDEPAGGGEISGDALDLGVLAKIAARLPLPAEVHAKLQAHPVQGLAQSVTAHWNGPLRAPRDWRVAARLSALAVGASPAPPRADGKPAEGVPGIAGAALELQATQAGGQATLSIRDGALEFPGVFEQPRIPLDELLLQARWRLQGERIEVDVDDLKLRNADATGNFKAHWHTADAKQPQDRRFPGVLDLEGVFSRADGARVHRYLPLGIPAQARHYVRDAIHKGQARDVAVRVKGNLLDVPFEKNPAAGEFRFAGQVQGVTMAYVPRAIQPQDQAPWPPLQELAGELIFDHNSMQVRKASARVQGHEGWQFTRIQAGIADLGHTRVVVDADGHGPLAAALGIVRQSPVAQLTRHALDHADADGQAALKLALDLPVARIREAQVSGQVTLQGNGLRITPDTPQMTQAQGAVSFSDTGFTVHDVHARLLGGQARVSGGMQPEGTAAPVLLRASGTASAEGLREMISWAPLPAIARQASGSAAYEARIDWHAGPPEITVSSDLRGMAFDLPAPLAKPADAAWPLRLELGRKDATGGERLRLTLAESLALEYQLDATATPKRVLRGALGIGPLATKDLALPEAGVSARLQLPGLPVDAWFDLANRLSDEQTLTDSGYLPTTWSLRVDELRAGARVLHDVAADGTRKGALWRADVQAQELSGHIEYREGEQNSHGQVHARLARLSIPAGALDESAPAEPPGKPASHLPALDIVADEFELRGKKLGRLEVSAVNRSDAANGAPQWQLTRLALHMPEADFAASGLWAASARDAARRTALDFTLDVQDAGALLARLGMPGALARGKGQLQGNIGWNGTPFSPHYPSMGGQLHLDVGAGQFLKAEPGITKLLGVLSLQALPRRLTLDFRDVFSSGFAFDFVRGDIAVQHGVASTNNLQMKGVNAAVLMEGNADLDRETQDLRVVVIPEIDASTAALVAAVINPAVGIGAFIAQAVLKRPLAKATTREFHINGHWDDPQVTRVERPAEAARPSATDPALPSQETHP